MTLQPLAVRVLSASICLAATSAVPAQSISPPLVEEASAKPAAVEGEFDAQESVAVDFDRHCPQYSGTRVLARGAPGKRCNAVGRVYGQEDIQRTGATDLADALRKLDPAIR